MTEVIARIKIKGKHYETLVDVDKALQLKQGKPISIDNVLAVNKIFYDSKKGLCVSDKDLEEAFGVKDIKTAAEKIIKSGEILVPKEYRDTERENKKKQIVDFLSRYAIDPRTEKPHTAERISAAIEQAGVSIDNKPMEQQISGILEKLKVILPIKIQTKKLKLRIPALHTGKIYGILSDYKEKENWLSNGDLECIINLPVGLQDDFYAKLNAITHGSAISQELEEGGKK